MMSGCPTIDSLSQAQKPYVLFYNFPVVLHNAIGLKSGKIAVDSALLRVEGFAGGSFLGGCATLMLQTRSAAASPSLSPVICKMLF